jgi:hypothetical protein
MMQPIWMLYSRRIFSRLAYWLSTLGYNARDRSLNNRLYLVYFIVFWVVWVGAVFAMLAEGLAGGLVLLPHAPEKIAAALGELSLAGWGFVLLWQVTRRSPFVFTEEDSTLVCQTPADRRGIGLALFLQSWLWTSLPFITGAVVLAFTLAETRLMQTEAGFRLGEYLLSSLRALSIIIPLQAGVMALLWALGAYRLHPADRRWMGWLAPVGLASVLLVAWLHPNLPSLSVAIRFPLHLPLEAAFRASSGQWIAGLATSLGWLISGLAMLSLALPRMVLAQAARETSRRALIQEARRYGINSLAEAISLRQRLGSSRAPSRLLSSTGASALFEKDEVQTRRWLMPHLVKLLWVGGLSLGIFMAPSWQLALVSAGMWTLAVGSLATTRLRSDLARWWMLRSLPVKPAALLRGELRLAWTGVVWLGWLSALVAPTQGTIKLYVLLMMPFLAASAGFAAAYDILHRCQARAIMSPSIAEENIPQVDIWGALLGLVSVLTPLGVLLAVAGLPGWDKLGAGAVLLAAGLAWFNYQQAVKAFRVVG